MCGYSDRRNGNGYVDTMHSQKWAGKQIPQSANDEKQKQRANRIQGALEDKPAQRADQTPAVEAEERQP